jgi:DMATS type aromatic prenyltransferase
VIVDDRRVLLDLLGEQWSGLCALTGIDPMPSTALLADLLGPLSATPLSHGPVSACDIADDRTPVEFSLAFNRDERPSLRILAEAQPDRPGLSPGLGSAEDFLRRQVGRPGFVLSRLRQVRDLFATDAPQGGFAMWQSLVFRAGREPEFKIYLNPEIHGVDRSAEVVGEAMARLGLSAAWQTIQAVSLRPGELGRADRLAFFALDLHDGPRTRIKVYVAHQDAETDDIVRAAGVAPGVNPEQAADFCAVAGGRPARFDGRPLMSSFTLASGHDRPVGYSVYVPIRSYVDDDAEARQRTMTLLDRHGFAGADLDSAIAAVARRPLDQGVGLLAHTSLRLGRPQPGLTVYLSAEAYHVSPPRTRRSLVG